MTMPIRDRWRRAGAACALLLLALSLPARAQEAPDAMVKRVSQDMLATIKSDPLIQAGNEARIREVIEVKLIPHFDFTRMTALAMGTQLAYRDARAADSGSPTSSSTLLVRTYSGALTQYRDETIDYKPLRMNPSDTEVTVRTLVMKSRGPARRRSTTASKRPRDGWKVYDVIVGGVSLVTNYRDEFNEQIKNGGVDGLIKTLIAAQQGDGGKMSFECSACVAGDSGFTADAGGARWTYAGALTFDDAGPVLEAALALPLPTEGVVDCSGRRGVRLDRGRGAARAEAARDRRGPAARLHRAPESPRGAGGALRVEEILAA